jgi:hypothetical protein
VGANIGGQGAGVDVRGISEGERGVAGGVSGGGLVGAGGDPGAGAGTLGEEELPAPPAPSKWTYSMTKLLIIEVELSSTTLSHPTSPLVEHNVSRDAHTLCHRVEDEVGLHAIRVADEDPGSAPVVELAGVAKLLNECNAAEDAKVADRQCAIVPHLVWRLAIECLGRRAVEQMNGGHHRLTPVDGRHPPLLEEGTSGGHHRLLAALDDAVLLWSVRRGVVALDALVGVVRRELSCRELAAVVHTQHMELAATFLFRSGLMTIDGVRSSYLGG